MAETQNPFTNFVSFAALNDPTKALKYQQQQLLAQQLMADGDKEIDPLRTAAGGVAIPTSPLEGLSKAFSKGLGAYVQNNNNKTLASLLGGNQDASVAAMNANGGGPTVENAKLAQGLSGQQSNAQSFLPPGMDMQTAMRISMLPGEALQKAALDRYMMTNEQKNFQDPNTRNNALAGGFVKTEGGMVPAGNLAQTFQPPQGMNPMMGNLVKAESGGNPNAVSSAGAQGIAQIMPATAAQPGYGVQPLQGMTNGNPASAPVPEQLRFSNDYLNAMQTHNGGDPRLAAAAYNAGPGRVDQALASLPAETQAYVPKVASPNVAQMNDPAYQAQVKAQGTKAGTTEAEARAMADKIYGNADSIHSLIQQMKTLAPNTIQGKGMPAEAQYYASANIGSKFGGGDQAAATDSFKNLSKRLFVNEIPTLTAGAGGRIDLPIARAGEAASGIDEFATHKSKQEVASQLDDGLARTLQNAANYYKNTTGKEYTPPQALSFDPSKSLINSDIETKVIGGVTYHKINGQWHQ